MRLRRQRLKVARLQLQKNKDKEKALDPRFHMSGVSDERVSNEKAGMFR